MYASAAWEHDCESITLLFTDKNKTVIWGNEFKLKILGSMFKNYI